MKQVLSVSIDLTKIPEEKILTVDKEGKPFSKGQKFVKLKIFVNDEKDQYGKDIKVTLEKAKDSQEATIYVGDGKLQENKE
jgi:hypothetical protein